jgi:hypothetical protein
VHVLRTTVAALPDRDDLLARLAFVEEALPSSNVSFDASSRLAFERAWARFARTDLNAGTDKTGRAQTLRMAIDDACTLLSSAAFERQTISRKIQLILALHNTLMGDPSPELLLVADLGLHRFRELLQDPELSEPDACAVYDALHSLYFSGVSDVRDLRRFDAIVAPFEAWLEARHGHQLAQRIPAGNSRPLTIAYFLHTAHLDRGNAVSPLIGSLAIMHAAGSDRRILVYAVQYVAPDFLAWMADHGIPVRTFDQQLRYDQIEEIAAALKSDGVDIAVTEQNRAIAAALFVRRVAPRQLWIDTGFPFWSLRALDWAVSPAVVGSADPSSRLSRITLRQTIETLSGKIDDAAVAQLRASFPTGAFVLGVFVRLIKLDLPYLDFLGRLLHADPRFYLVIAGPGNSRAVEAFVSRDNIAGRVTFVPGNVDLKLYGPAIDLMCDTFPFIGGLACREVAACGTPVLSKLGTPWDMLLKADRNPDLLAANENEYIALALRIAADKAFRDSQRSITLQKANSYSDPKQMVDDIEAAISASMAYDPEG